MMTMIIKDASLRRQASFRAVPLMMMAVILPACRPVRFCWTPADATPGWKEVALPAGASQLAAPIDVDQYRPGERALAWQEDYAAPVTWRPSLGSIAFELPLSGVGWDAVELTFARPLAGQQIEATADTPHGRDVVLSRTRSQSSTVRLLLKDPQTSFVRVVAHPHGRAAPRVVSWRAGRWQRPPGHAATLVFRQPLGPPVQLCQTAGELPAFHGSDRPDRPRPVALAATWRDRIRRYVW